MLLPRLFIEMVSCKKESFMKWETTGTYRAVIDGMDG